MAIKDSVRDWLGISKPVATKKEITATEFKKQISRPFGSEMRKMGFKGSGFHFARSSKDFVFIIGIQASYWGPSCYVEFGVQPFALTTNGFNTVDFKKLKYYQCEFRTRLSPRSEHDRSWNYSRNEKANITTALEIVQVIKERVLPTIDIFEQNPKILEQIEVEDLNEGGLNRKIGMIGLANTIPRLAWVFSLINETTNLAKAKEFASYGLSTSEVPHFFAIPDFERILGKECC